MITIVNQGLVIMIMSYISMIPSVMIRTVLDMRLPVVLLLGTPWFIKILNEIVNYDMN